VSRILIIQVLEHELMSKLVLLYIKSSNLIKFQLSDMNTH